MLLYGAGWSRTAIVSSSALSPTAVVIDQENSPDWHQVWVDVLADPTDVRLGKAWGTWLVMGETQHDACSLYTQVKNSNTCIQMGDLLRNMMILVWSILSGQNHHDVCGCPRDPSAPTLGYCDIFMPHLLGNCMIRPPSLMQTHNATLMKLSEVLVMSSNVSNRHLLCLVMCQLWSACT